MVVCAAAAAAAQESPAIALRIQPRVGDTLHTRFEQDVVMTAVTKVHGRDTTMVTSTSVLVLARVIVQTSSKAGCTMVAITDSVAALTMGEMALLPGESARRALQGRRIVLRVAPDGSSELVDDRAALEPELGSFVSAMPSVLPGHPVAEGASWESAMAIPVGGQSGRGRGARLRVLYHFDSLTAGGGLAYLTMRGRVARDSSDAPVEGGQRMASRGDVDGALTLNRERGWWNDSRLTITLRSVITPAPGNDVPPVRVQTRITQRLHTEAPAPHSTPSH